jgi:cytoskeletal protein RodZ
MRIAGIVGLALALLIAGCSSKPAAPGAQAPSAAAPVAPAQPAAPSASTSTAGTTSAPATARPPVSSSSTSTASTPSGAAARETANAAVAPSTAAGKSGVIPASPAAKASAAANAKAPVAQPPKKESAAPEVAKKSPPALDLTSLEQRLKDTEAIGVLTKIALKNQVDDLLAQFRAFYQGKVKTTLAELRRPYDLLVLKVLSLLQDSDPALASAIVASREAIWGILADPKKFATI